MNSQFLEYFKDLLESNKYEELKSSAIKGILEYCANWYIHLDSEKGIVQYIDFDIDEITQEPFQEECTYDFQKEFALRVKKEAETVQNRIDQEVIEINRAGVNADQFVRTQVKELQYLISKAKTLYPKHTFIEDSLLGVLKYLVDKNSLSESFKKQNEIKTAKTSFFDVKSTTKRSLLQDVYDTAVDLEVLDDEVVTEETFLNVLTGNPSKTNEVIIFKCNNQLVVHFLNCIQCLFNNLTFSQIHKSGSFVNSRGKILKQADLDNANSRLKRNTSLEVDRITAHLSKIVKP